MIVSGSKDGTIKLWTDKGELVQSFSEQKVGVNSVSFSPDGKMIASATWKVIALWTGEGKLLHTLSGHRDTVNIVSFSPDGKTIVSGSRDGTVIRWNLDLNDLLVRGCNLVRDYLKTSPNVSESDRTLCDGIGTSVVGTVARS
jgi:WD40 repeat protein